MNKEDKPGQITAAVGRVHLRLKKATEPPQGQLFARCEFIGRGGSFFVPTPPAAAEGRAPAEAGNAPGSPPAPTLSAQSKLVDIIEGNTTSKEEERNSAPVEIDGVAGDATVSSPIPKDVIVVDVGFRLDTTKFDLTEHNLSILNSTEVKIQLCLCTGDGAAGIAADDAATVIGVASVQVAAILRGQNEWTDELALGTYVPQAQPDTEHPEEGGETQDNGELGVASAEVGSPATSPDLSPGPLEFGGSTSTVRVTLLTNDETADYTVGAGSLWADGAEVTGVPEGWKVVPPPETERSAWNETIANILSGQARHAYSIWWGVKPEASSNETSDVQEHEGTKAFPPMRLDGGVLNYEPDEESVNVQSIANESAEDVGSQGQASISTSSRGGKGGGGGSRRGSGGEENDPPPQAPWDPPTGTWSVRFPSFCARSLFLHRTSMRELRRALTSSNQEQGETKGDDKLPDGGNQSQQASEVPAKAVLPVFLERRELKPDPAQPPPPIETPWRCRAFMDLSPLVQPAAPNGREDHGAHEAGHASTSLPAVQSGVTETKTGDSPLRAELRASLGLNLHAMVEDAPLADTGDPSETRREEAAPAISAATGAAGVADANGTSGESSPANDVESRIEQMKVANTTLFVTFALSRPLVKATARQETTAAVSDLFVPNDIGPRKPPRDVDVELKEELDTFVQASLEKYAELFLEPSADEKFHNMSAEDREKHLFYALNSGGLYHSFLERLKPRVQRIVRKRFGAVPADATEADAFISDLYVHLVEQAAEVLNHRIRKVETKATPSYIKADAEISLEERVEHFGMLADDAEARGSREEAAARHEDRIEAATEAASSLEEWRVLLARSWEEYALFSLRGGRCWDGRRAPSVAPINTINADGSTVSSGKSSSTSLDHAARCLEESLRVFDPGSEGSLRATSVLAVVSMEQGQLDRAWALLETALELRLPALEEGADGYETDDLASLVPQRDHALRCILRDLMGDPAGARRSLFLAVQSSKKEGEWGLLSRLVPDDEPRAPRRTPVRVMQDACAWLLELSLPGAAHRAFAVAEESERLAVKKAKERGLPTRTPIALRESSRRLQCYLLLAEQSPSATLHNDKTVASHLPPGGALDATQPVREVGSATVKKAETVPAVSAEDSTCDGKGTNESGGMSVTAAVATAERLAQEAVELAPEDPRPWQALAEACDAQGSVKATEAADAWAAVLDRLERDRVASRDGGNGNNPPPPLRVYMRLGALYNTLGRIEEAKACFLRACRVWRVPGPWLGCGAACLRLEQWQEAEDALQYASRLDCNSPLVWGHLALLLLSLGEDRLQEADHALSQALCLGLADPSLLREIGNCYVAAGRLDAAEDALRKSLAADMNNVGVGGGGRAGSGGNPHTRRCLGDVLSARNSTSQAVDEYRRVLESPGTDVDESERREVLTRCGALLRKMGRGDELDQLEASARQQQLLT
ncbi:unnamed protein product [Scytosiphon promiscuus]